MTRTLTALLLLASVTVSTAQVNPQWLRVIKLRTGTPVKVLVTGMAPAMQVSTCRSHRGTWILVGTLVGIYAGFAIGAAAGGTETSVGIGGDIGAVAGGVATARLTRCRPVDVQVYHRPLR